MHMYCVTSMMTVDCFKSLRITDDRYHTCFPDWLIVTISGMIVWDTRSSKAYMCQTYVRKKYKEPGVWNDMSWEKV